MNFKIDTVMKRILKLIALTIFLLAVVPIAIVVISVMSIFTGDSPAKIVVRLDRSLKRRRLNETHRE